MVKVHNLEQWRTTKITEQGFIPAERITGREWNLAVGPGARLFEKLHDATLKLGDVADIFVGLQTSADDVFILDLLEERSRTLRLMSKSLARKISLEKGMLFPLISGTDVKRYQKLPERQYIIFPYQLSSGIPELVDWDRIEKEYPKLAAYLQENRKRLVSRESGKGRGRNWYGYIYLKNLSRQARRKLCVPRLVHRLHAAYDSTGKHFLDNVDVGGICLRSDYARLGYPYLLGLLNSGLHAWHFPDISAPFRGGWRSANRQFLSQLPIRPINFSDRADKARHDKMTGLVQTMLELHNKLPAAKNPHDKESLQRLIDATDRQIDQLVYELYALTRDEIKIVETGP
jgi:hypothetical protein